MVLPNGTTKENHFILCSDLTLSVVIGLVVVVMFDDVLCELNKTNHVDLGILFDLNQEIVDVLEQTPLRHDLLPIVSELIRLVSTVIRLYMYRPFQRGDIAKVCYTHIYTGTNIYRAYILNQHP